MQCFVHVQASVVVDVSHLPEAVHEVTHSGPRGSNHFCQRFLVYLWDL